MSIKRWVYQSISPAMVAELEKGLGISKLVASSLVSSGVCDVEEARHFIECDYYPEQACNLADIDRAAERIVRAVDGGERIAIFGDYDVDGVASTALMYQYLSNLGADISYCLPTRDGCGYGLNAPAVDDLNSQGITLIITVDNGVSAHEAVDRANEHGIDVIVCDHHKVPPVLPAAYAVVDPLREDDKSSFKSLAGVGVAMKLACAVEGCTVEEMLELYGDLVALGTVSDVMPLMGENRVIVKNGVEMLRNTDNLGLMALMRHSGLAGKELTARDVAFVIAPRLNAAGRMGTALTALHLLLAEDEEQADSLAEELCELNRQRQAIEQEMLAQVMHSIVECPELIRRQILVISGENYNAGVAGIVCSRLVERFGRPVLIMSIDGDEAKGSGRSVDGFSLYNAINSCSDIFENYGGHDMAAGFTIKTDRIDELRRRLNEYCIALDSGVPFRSVRITAKVEFEDLGEQEVRELSLLAPFGCGNEEPVFAVNEAQVVEISPLRDGHSRFTFRKNGHTFKAALFCTPPSALVYKAGDIVDVALMLSIYVSSGGRSYVSAKIKTIKPSSFSDESLNTMQIYDLMCCGRKLTRDQFETICPTRAEIGRVYRIIQKETLPAFDREYLCYRCRDINAGKSIVALGVLLELGLVYGKCMDEGDRRLIASDNPEKKQLTDSPLYRQLTDGIKEE